MSSYDVFPGLLGDVVLPAVSGIVYTAFTTVHALTTHVLPWLKNGEPERAPVEAVGKFFSRQSGGTVSPEEAGKFYDILESKQWYWKEPGVFVSHNFLSIFWAVLSPLQFSSTIRNKYPEFHKHSGRLLLLTLVPTTATGFRLGMNSKVGKPLMMALGVVLAGYVYLQSFLGYKAITSKPKRVFDHRLAMTKLGICLLGIPLIRLVFFSILVPIIGKLPWPVRTQPDGTQKMIQTLGMSFYTTVLATITGAEVYGFLLQRNKNKLTKSV